MRLSFTEIVLMGCPHNVRYIVSVSYPIKYLYAYGFLVLCIYCCYIITSMQHRFSGIKRFLFPSHYDDVKMCSMASQITSLTIIYSTVYSGTDLRKHQSSASLAFVQGIHRGPVNSPHKWPVTRKCFHLMTSSWSVYLQSRYQPWLVMLITKHQVEFSSARLTCFCLARKFDGQCRNIFGCHAIGCRISPNKTKQSTTKCLKTLRDTLIKVASHDRHGVSNNRQLECLVNSLFRPTAKGTPKIRITDRFVKESRRWSYNSLKKWLVMRKAFPCHNVIT